MTRTVILVRHADSVVPTPGRPDDPDRGLTSRGVRQADELAASLISHNPGAFVSSPYRRAMQTIAPAARVLGADIEVDSDLREWDSGLTPRPDYASYFKSSWASPGFERPGGESLDSLTRRGMRTVFRISESVTRNPSIVASHGTFISRTLVGLGLPVDWGFSNAMPMPAVYLVHFSANGVEVSGPGL